MPTAKILTERTKKELLELKELVSKTLEHTCIHEWHIGIDVTHYEKPCYVISYRLIDDPRDSKIILYSADQVKSQLLELLVKYEK